MRRRAKRRVGTWNNPIKGVLGDTLKAMPGCDAAAWTKRPKRIGSNKRGWKVLWFYDGAIVELRVFKWRKDPDGPQNAYRVHSVIGSKRKAFAENVLAQMSTRSMVQRAMA